MSNNNTTNNQRSISVNDELWELYKNHCASQGRAVSAALRRLMQLDIEHGEKVFKQFPVVIE